MPLRRLLFELSKCTCRRGDGREWSEEVETAGLEPATPCLQSRCSPS